MRKAHKLAYYEGYAMGIAGGGVGVIDGTSRRWKRAYDQGQADGMRRRSQIEGGRRLGDFLPDRPH